MSGIAIAKLTSSGIEHGVKCGDKFGRQRVPAEAQIHLADQLADFGDAGRMGTKGRSGTGHHQRGRHPLPHHVCDDKADLPVGILEKVIEVAPEFGTGLIDTTEFIMAIDRSDAGNHPPLNLARKPNLTIQPLGLLRIASEPCVHDGRRDLRSDRLHQQCVKR